MSIGPAADSLPTAWLSCAALIDGGLTATLLYTVLRERRQHHEHTRQLLHNIAGLTLETGKSSNIPDNLGNAPRSEIALTVFLCNQSCSHTLLELLYSFCGSHPELVQMHSGSSLSEYAQCRGVFLID